nr:hypothetical protein [Tanacetum cinerariifolium]
NDDSFSVNSVRKHIDEHSLPYLFPCTRWYKMIPKKTLIRFLAWFVMGMLNRMTTSFSLVTRLLQIGILFDHGLICLFQAFSRVKIGPTGLIHGMFLGTKRAPPSAVTNFRCRKQGRHEESPSKRCFCQKLLSSYLLLRPETAILVTEFAFARQNMKELVDLVE